LETQVFALPNTMLEAQHSLVGKLHVYRFSVKHRKERVNVGYDSLSWRD